MSSTTLHTPDTSGRGDSRRARLSEARGLPQHPDDLEDGRRMVGFRSSATGTAIQLEIRDGRGSREMTLPTTLTVNAAESYLAAAKLGLGLIQLPRYDAQSAVNTGGLAVVLEAFQPEPTPVSLLYPRDRQLSPRVRAFIDWTVRTFAAK